jgi:hypothetical protein
MMVSDTSRTSLRLRKYPHLVILKAHADPEQNNQLFNQAIMWCQERFGTPYQSMSVWRYSVVYSHADLLLQFQDPDHAAECALTWVDTCSS